MTLSMAAYAWLAVAKTLSSKGETSMGDDMMIGYTVPEVRRLLAALIVRLYQPEHHIWWSHWRRRRQNQARLSHYNAAATPSAECRCSTKSSWQSNPH